MTQIKEAYVSFETAKLLKEKGFDELCIAYWFCMTGVEPILIENIPRGHYNNVGNNIETIGCPTQQMAMHYLREKSGLFISIGNDDLDYNWQIFDVKNRTEDFDPTYLTISYAGYKTYEEACEAAIKYCLENLI